MNQTEGEAGRRATKPAPIDVDSSGAALSLCSVKEEKLRLPFAPGVQGCAPRTEEVANSV
ncbi:hypothetical protein HispidOSU_000277 [Sigmodon hispidus]